ncbi:cell division suppressor protein YneA [Heyndrickxia camelliae]|nr:LysM peptidoglycan-binding domain-containing protein [Heyndrickxia camelliae]
MLMLWKNYSYAIILVILSFILGITFIFHMDDHSTSYEHVIVSEGQSLWSIADTYKMENGMTHTEFIKWVQKENNLKSTDIEQGQTIIIPVKIKDKKDNMHHLASDIR